MKKLALTLLSVLACGTVQALPVGNPWEASLHCDGVFCEGECVDFCDPCVSWCDAWSFRLGFYGDYVFNRHMQLDRGGNNDIEKTRLNTNAAYLAFNMWNRVDVFATFGASNIRIETPGSSFSGLFGNIPVILNTETAFSWSVGGRGTLWECGCFGVGLEGQYFRTNPDIEYVRFDANQPIYLNGAELEYSEWQVALGAAYRINISSCSTALVPYVAVAWSGSKGDMDEFAVVDTGTVARLYDIESEKLWSFVTGTTLLGCDKASVTVEGRFAAEKAVYVNGQFRF